MNQLSQTIERNIASNKSFETAAYLGIMDNKIKFTNNKEKDKIIYPI
jgi:hypothetical protein